MKHTKTSLPEAVQKEVARIRERIAITKQYLPNGNVAWGMYEAILNEADRAVREQDAVEMVRLLPELESMN